MGDQHNRPRSKSALGLRAPYVERRVSTIRGHIVPLVQSHGQGHQCGCVGVSGPLHLTTWNCRPFRFVLRVPFRPPGVPGTTATQRPDAIPNPVMLPYGLDVWRRQRVLSLAWDPDGRIEVVGFLPGVWEVETLSL
jgi:hypothetical protein